jgi:hypothetical protein
MKLISNFIDFLKTGLSYKGKAGLHKNMDLIKIYNSLRQLLSIGLNGNFLRFRRDGVSISYTVICLSHFDVCLAIT